MKKAGYDDDDLRQINERIDAALETERDEKKVSSDKRKRAVKMAEAEAKSLGIDVAALRKARRLTALQKAIEDETASVKDNAIELVGDMVSVISEWGDTPLGAFVEDAIEKRLDAAAENAEAEQAEGAAVLDELTAPLH